MLKIKFTYWNINNPNKKIQEECVVGSMKDCMHIYGLNSQEIEYEILSIDFV